MHHRIKDTLPPPTQCDNCCSVNIQFTANDKVYGRLCGDWPYCWFCEDCRAIVGCHNGTEIPLGRMADRNTRKLRKSAHEAFDLLWSGGLMSRNKAYSWLAVELGIAVRDCHISWLTKEQLQLAITLSRNQFKNNAHILRRRRQKDEARKVKRDHRTFRQARRFKDERR